MLIGARKGFKYWFQQCSDAVSFQQWSNKILAFISGPDST